MEGLELSSLIAELLEEAFEGREESIVVVGFDSSTLDFRLKLCEGSVVGALRPLEEAKDCLDVDRLQLLVNRVQVGSLVLPELELD